MIKFDTKKIQTKAVLDTIVQLDEKSLKRIILRHSHTYHTKANNGRIGRLRRGHCRILSERLARGNTTKRDENVKIQSPVTI